MAAVRRLGFVGRRPPMKSTWWSPSLCKISLESTQRGVHNMKVLRLCTFDLHGNAYSRPQVRVLEACDTLVGRDVKEHPRTDHPRAERCRMMI